MFCSSCGCEVGENFRFCGKCGAEVAPSVPASITEHRPARNMQLHVTILGWLFVGNAILTALAGCFILFAGHILERLPIVWPADIPFDVSHLATFIATAFGLSLIILAAGIAAAGIGLLSYRSWARVLAIIVAVLLIFNFPLGTAVAIYTFWILLSDQGRAFYNTRTAAAA